ncbi:MAG: fibronectin type III domain-containing protein [Desulfobacterales bacterium]
MPSMYNNRLNSLCLTYWQMVRSTINKKITRNLKFLISFIVLFIGFATPVGAIDVTLQWTPNNEPDLAGYRVFYREEDQSYDYENPYWESIDPVCTIYDLDEIKTYYFVVRAFDTNGSESADSNEVLLMEGVPVNQTPTENISSGDGDDIGCFIATAAYGSMVEPHVKILRDFRDRFLMTDDTGKIFVELYYKYSPPLARFIARHDNLRMMVRIALFPVVGVSWISLKSGVSPAIIIMIIFGIGVVGSARVWKKFRG